MWLRAANLLSFWFEKFFMNISFPKQVTALGSLQFSPSSAGAECFASRPQTGEAGLEPSTFKSIYLVLSSLLPVSFLFPLAWVWGSFITNRRAVTQVKAKGMNSTVEKTMVVEGGGKGGREEIYKNPKVNWKAKDQTQIPFLFLSTCSTHGPIHRKATVTTASAHRGAFCPESSQPAHFPGSASNFSSLQRVYYLYKWGT